MQNAKRSSFALFSTAITQVMTHKVKGFYNLLPYAVLFCATPLWAQEANNQENVAVAAQAQPGFDLFELQVDGHFPNYFATYKSIKRIYRQKILSKNRFLKPPSPLHKLKGNSHASHIDDRYR